MRVTAHIGVIATAVFLTGCVSNPAWNHYRNAQSCHFKHGENCDQYYLLAIESDPDLPGIHSSYGAHQISRGKINEGLEQLQKEASLHPEVGTALKVVIDAQSKLRSKQ